MHNTDRFGSIVLIVIMVFVSIWITFTGRSVSAAPDLAQLQACLASTTSPFTVGTRGVVWDTNPTPMCVRDQPGTSGIVRREAI